MSTPDDTAGGPPAGGRRAFVLGGGGRWGAVEVGMLKALVEAGIEPDLVLGNSVGAFNGALFAADPSSVGIEHLERLWTDVAERNLLAARPLDWARTLYRTRVAIQDPEPLRRLLDDALVVDRIEDLNVPFQCVASSIDRATERWFTEGPLIDSLMASAAIPVLLPPVEIDDQLYYDGGLVNSVPVDRAIELGATEVFVLQVGRLEQPLRRPRAIHEAALIAFEISRRHRFSTLRDRTFAGVDVHILPSANDIQFDDRRQAKWSDLSETATLVEGAYRASSTYLAELVPPA